MKKSKFNQHSEQYLPKIDPSNGTLNYIPSSLEESQYSNSMNFAQQQRIGQLVSPKKLKSPSKLAFKQSEKAFQAKQFFSKPSSKHSFELLQSPSEYDQQMRRSKYNLPSETFLPKIQASNGTLNEKPQYNMENQQQKNFVNQNGNSSLDQYGQIVLSSQNYMYAMNPQSQKGSTSQMEYQQPLQMKGLNQHENNYLVQNQQDQKLISSQNYPYTSNPQSHNGSKNLAEHQQSQWANGVNQQGNNYLVQNQQDQRLLSSQKYSYASNPQSHNGPLSFVENQQPLQMNGVYQQGNSQLDPSQHGQRIISNSSFPYAQNPQLHNGSSSLAEQQQSQWINGVNQQGNNQLASNQYDQRGISSENYPNASNLQSQNGSSSLMENQQQQSINGVNQQGNSQVVQNQQDQRGISSQNYSYASNPQSQQNGSSSLAEHQQPQWINGVNQQRNNQLAQNQYDQRGVSSQNYPYTQNLQSQNGSSSLALHQQPQWINGVNQQGNNQLAQNQHDQRGIYGENYPQTQNPHSLNGSSSLVENQQSQWKNGVNQQGNSQLNQTQSGQKIVFIEDHPNASNSQQKNNSPNKKQQAKTLKRTNQSKSKSQTHKNDNLQTHLGDNISLTNRQIALQKQQENQSEAKKVVNFAQDQLTSPFVENDNNTTNNKEDTLNHKTNGNKTNSNNFGKDSKKYSKYANYLDKELQIETKSELFKLIQSKAAPSAQHANQIINNHSNLMNSAHIPQQAAIVGSQQARLPMKCDLNQLQIRKQAKLKFKKVKLRLRILLGFFNKLRKAAAKRREHFFQELQSGALLKDAIMDIMKISIKVSRESFMMLFQEENTLDFYNYIKDRQNYILRRQRIRQYTYNITSDYIDSSHEILQFNTSFIKFLSLHTKNYNYVVDNFWPSFILDRLEFTNYGQIKNITQEQREMISIYMYFVFGLCNRLVRPWQALKIQENYVKEKNAQLILSLTFYMMLDYLKEKNPIVTQNSYSQIPEQYRPVPRTNPLNTYNDTLKKDKMFWIGCQNDAIGDYNVSSPDLDKIHQELESQKIINEKIMIGLHPRKDLEDLIKNDNQLKQNVQTCLKKGAVLVLERIYSFNLKLNENLFNFVE
ncbi:hypothetical protein ABPG72_013261 [Tetrahymena utriculariae]